MAIPRTRIALTLRDSEKNEGTLHFFSPNEPTLVALGLDLLKAKVAPLTDALIVQGEVTQQDQDPTVDAPAFANLEEQLRFSFYHEDKGVAAIAIPARKPELMVPDQAIPDMSHPAVVAFVEMMTMGLPVPGGGGGPIFFVDSREALLLRLASASEYYTTKRKRRG